MVLAIELGGAIAGTEDLLGIFADLSLVRSVLLSMKGKTVNCGQNIGEVIIGVRCTFQNRRRCFGLIKVNDARNQASGY